MEGVALAPLAPPLLCPDDAPLVWPADEPPLAPPDDPPLLPCPCWPDKTGVKETAQNKMTARQCALLIICLKLSRQTADPHAFDAERAGFEPSDRQEMFKTLTFLQIVLYLEIALQKRADLIACHIFERKLAHGVMAARQHGNTVIPAELARPLDDLFR